MKTNHNTFIVKFVRISILLVLFLIFLVIPSLNDTSLADTTIISKTLNLGLAIALIFSFIPFIIFGLKTIKITQISAIDITLFALVSYIFINRIFRIHLGDSIRLVDLIELILFYSIIRCQTTYNLIILCLAVVMSGIGQSLVGIFQIFGYLSPMSVSAISGSFQNSGPYAGFLAIIGCVSWAMYLNKDNLITLLTKLRGHIPRSIIIFGLNYIPLIGIATITITLPATHSRAADISYLLGTCCLLLLKFYKTKRVSLFFLNGTSIKKSVLLLSTILLLAFGAYKIYQVKKESVDGRFLIWNITLNIINANPIFGVGFDQFKAVYMNAQANYFSKTNNAQEILRADNTYYAFNDLLQFTAEEGIAGVVILSFSLYVFVKWIIKKNVSPIKNIVISILLSFFLFGMFSYPMQILPIKMLLVIAFSLMAKIDGSSYLKLNFSWSNFAIAHTVAINVIIISICFTIASGLFISILKFRSAYKNWFLGLVNYNYKDYPTSLIYFERAFPQLKQNGDFLMTYGKALNLSGNPINGKKELESACLYLNNSINELSYGDACKALGRITEAEAAYKKASLMIPNRFYPNYLLVKLYQETNQNEKARKGATDLLKKPVKIPSKAIEQMQIEMNALLNSYATSTINNPVN